MSSDRLVRQYIEAINQKDPSPFAALFAVEAVLHDPFFPEPTRGRDAIHSMIEGIFAGVPGHGMEAARRHHRRRWPRAIVV